jgi:hypothetical protein
VNVDAICNARDATRTLVHAAQAGAGGDNAKVVKFSEWDDAIKAIVPTDEELAANFENFITFLADCDTETADGEHRDGDVKITVNSADATLMLRYSARYATNAPSTFWIADAGKEVKDVDGNVVKDADGNAVLSMASLLFKPFPTYSYEVAVGTGMIEEEATETPAEETENTEEK